MQAKGMVPRRSNPTALHRYHSFLCEKGNLSWQLHSTTYKNQMRGTVDRQGRRNNCGVRIEQNPPRGVQLRRGKTSRLRVLAGGIALQDNCEYNPFRYESYPFNAYSQPFSFAFPFWAGKGQSIRLDRPTVSRIVRGGRCFDRSARFLEALSPCFEPFRSPAGAGQLSGAA